MAEPDPDPLEGEDINPDDEFFAKAPEKKLDDDDILILFARAIEGIDA